MKERFLNVAMKFGLVALVAILSLCFLAVGLMIGYSFFGGGEDPLSILSIDHWQAIISKFTGN
ncbi:DNA-directed RNA polymerase subunit beta [Streptococcus zalophi]|uniref:DNA-directed RNA polymerase subunit beta n=1 Tax=Streptococcus zalophi TaxID=640031 RepID=A0A934P9L7_9STRE|nr:DNA-directed RNA polymerase subunit beta [Streptococcus zalophi]MBJ8349569.1 DNA-directed RNA polymerase subunit beta [Streptococcus zalophi]MCR8968081.1 DNA-directed RNA polymerase subunit beta [Streptococcus zalophi]